jgi:hydroxyethylthiazole kinase
VTHERTWPHPEIKETLAGLRRLSPLVHCITNLVADNLTANVLLAVGASPAMVIAPEEAGGFAAVANALLLNVGTVTAQDAQAMRAAAASAREAKKPWVLDPVGAGALPYRTRIVEELLRERPAVIRGNASEILALAGAASSGKGVDSTQGSKEALPGARELASRLGTVVAVSGAVDYVTDGSTVVAVPGGNPIVTRVTATGCALGAVMAACTAAASSPLLGAVAASALFKAAAERAGRVARGTGSFAVAFLDELCRIGVEPDEPLPSRPAR